MSDYKLLKQLLYSKLHDGKHSQHKPWKRYKDCLKSNLVNITIDSGNWEILLLRRFEWRIHVDDGCISLRMQNSCQLRKGNTCNVDENVNKWRWETCGWILPSKAEYVSHWKSQKKPSVHKGLFLGIYNVNSAICNKVYKSVSDLKSHTVEYKRQIP